MTRAGVIFAAKLVVAGVILAFLVATGKLTLDPLRKALASVPTWSAYCGLYFSVMLLSVARWNLILRTLSGSRVPLSSLVRFSWVGLFFSNVTPSVIGTDATKYAFLRHRGIHASDVVTSLLLDRLASLMGLLLLFLAFGLPLAADVFSSRTALLLLLVLLAAAGGTLLAYRFRRALRIRPKLEQFRESLRAGLRDKSVPLLAVSISVVTHLLKASSLLAIAAVAAPRTLPIWDFFGVCSVGFLIEALPITPAGIGTGHLAFEYLFSLHGVPGGAALYNAYFVGRLALNSLGAILWISR